MAQGITTDLGRPKTSEDQVQPIESDRVSTTLPPDSTYPINPAAIIAGYDINNPTLRFQPRAYTPGYRIPERILSYTASVQQVLPGNSVLTVAYAGSQGRNLFLRSITNKIGVIRSTVEKTVGLGANRQVQLSLRLNF